MEIQQRQRSARRPGCDFSCLGGRGCTQMLDIVQRVCTCMYLQPQTLPAYTAFQVILIQSLGLLVTYFAATYSSWSDIYFMAAPIRGAPCMITVHYRNLDAPSQFLQRELCLSISSHFNLTSRYNMTWPAPVRF